MSKAAELSAKLERVEGEDGITLIEESIQDAIHFDAEGDVLCIMHSDGSANFIDQTNALGVMVEVISPANIVKVLKHYRPFTAVFKGKVQ
jgi:hypothetical protein